MHKYGVWGHTPSENFYPVRACAKGLSNWFCPSVSLSVCQFVSQSGEIFLNLNIDRVKQFPNLTVALTLQKSDLCVPHRKQSGSIPSAFPAVSYLRS